MTWNSLPEGEEEWNTSSIVRTVSLIVVLFGCGLAPSVMQYHRQTLDDLARDQLDCVDPLNVRDTTPAEFVQVGNDPETRRYTVDGCERSATYVCFTVREVGDSGMLVPTCRPLRRGDGALGGIYVGPLRVH